MSLYFRRFIGVKDLERFLRKWMGLLWPRRPRLKESCDRSERITTWGDVPDRRVRWLPDVAETFGSDLRLRLPLALPLLLLLTWFSVSLALRSSLVTSWRDRVIGLLRGMQAGSMVTTFLRIPPSNGGADDDDAGNDFLAHLLLSKLSTVGIRLRNTLRGVAFSIGVVASNGKLVSSRDGATGDTSLTTGAERRAASSEDVLFSGLRWPLDASLSTSGTVSSGLATTSSGFRIGMSRPVSGGPGGSSNAVTAVQLSARNLFIIQ